MLGEGGGGPVGVGDGGRGFGRCGSRIEGIVKRA